MAKNYRDEFISDALNGIVKGSELERKRELDSIRDKAQRLALNQFSNLELARKRAAFAKWKATENLDKMILDWESAFSRKGGKVIWAPEAADAVNEVLQIIKNHKAQSVIKSKSNLAEEIGLNNFLRKNNIESIESDLGVWIADQLNYPSNHMVMPVLDKSFDQISSDLLKNNIFKNKPGSAEDLSLMVSKEIRSKLNEIKVGITGANFLVADQGSIVITENEGNNSSIHAKVNVQIILAGIDKLIPSLTDLDYLLPLLSTYATGQEITAYNTIINSPKLDKESDGPDEIYVILIDNGRTDLLSKTEQREALHCIKCGACAHVCPTYKLIGGAPYHTPYSGPIGAVSAPHMQNYEQQKHLNYSSTFCGACNDVCPVKIDIHHLLEINRKEMMENKEYSTSEKYAWLAWKKAMLNRKWMNQSSKIKNILLKQAFKKEWGNNREFPNIQNASFNELWREKNPS